MSRSWKDPSSQLAQVLSKEGKIEETVSLLAELR
jgi:hypothetical protein